MRVLHLVTRFLSAGSERNMLASMRWEREQGHEVHLAVGGESDEAVGGESDERGVPDDIEVHRLPSLVRAISPRADLRARQEVCDLLTSTPFDVLHTHQSKAGVVGRIAGRGRVPVTVHTVHTASFGPGSSMLASVAFPTAERVCARFTNLIVCVGEELREMYLDASIGQPRQFRVLRSPIDVDRFATGRHVTLDDRAALRARFGVRDGARMLLSIGALEPRKRHALLVQRLAPLLRSGQADLVIAGDGPERLRLQQLAAEAGCADAVHLLGFVEDVPAV
ncbi:MAG: glycosyltransferase, partial [Dehalococcoidia bacterium]